MSTKDLTLIDALTNLINCIEDYETDKSILTLGNVYLAKEISKKAIENIKNNFLV